MTDAISRSELLKKFPPNMENHLWHFTGIRAAIEAAPTLDVAPVVRCESCMRRRTFECPMYSETDGSDYGLGIIINDRTDDDGYCHCGARMDGEAE